MIAISISLVLLVAFMVGKASADGTITGFLGSTPTTFATLSALNLQQDVAFVSGQVGGNDVNSGTPLAMNSFCVKISAYSAITYDDTPTKRYYMAISQDGSTLRLVLCLMTIVNTNQVAVEVKEARSSTYPIDLNDCNWVNAVYDSNTYSSSTTLAVPGNTAGQGIFSITLRELTQSPSLVPTAAPSVEPSITPSQVPTATPSSEPSEVPSLLPTMVPSSAPPAVPSVTPSQEPTLSPSSAPSAEPTITPSQEPTLSPSSAPSAELTITPSQEPTLSPSSAPSAEPSASPSQGPTIAPSSVPSKVPTGVPSKVPSAAPSFSPSQEPTVDSSTAPSAQPSVSPTQEPTPSPSIVPSLVPSFEPSPQPSVTPSAFPSTKPSRRPSAIPSRRPTVFKYPTSKPNVKSPTFSPTAEVTRVILGANLTVGGVDMGGGRRRRLAPAGSMVLLEATDNAIITAVANVMGLSARFVSIESEHVVSDDEVLVVMKMLAPSNNFASAEECFAHYSVTLTTAIESDALYDEILTVSDELGASQLYQITALNSTTVTNFGVVVPYSASNKEDDLTAGEFSGLVIGVIVAFLVLLGLVYMLIVRFVTKAEVVNSRVVDDANKV